MTTKNKQRQKQIPCGNDKQRQCDANASPLEMATAKAEASFIRLIFLTGGGWYAMLKRQV
jgi:hypothetical protein